MAGLFNKIGRARRIPEKLAQYDDEYLLYSLSGADMAKKEYFRLKDDMTQEEIDVVTEHLKKNSMIRYEELFGV